MVNLWRPVITIGELLRRCVEVHIAIEVSFGVVSEVGPGIHMLDGFWHFFTRFMVF